MDADAIRRHEVSREAPGVAPVPERPDAVVRSEGLVGATPLEAEQVPEAQVRAERAERRLRYHSKGTPRRYGK